MYFCYDTIQKEIHSWNSIQFIFCKANLQKPQELNYGINILSKIF